MYLYSNTTIIVIVTLANITILVHLSPSSRSSPTLSLSCTPNERATVIAGLEAQVASSIVARFGLCAHTQSHSNEVPRPCNAHASQIQVLRISSE